MASEAEKNLRELGIDPGELYDGPKPGETNVTFLAPPAQQVNRAAYVDTLTAALNVLSARLLGMIATIGAVFMFGWAVFDPEPWRLAAVGTYAAVVLWPIVFLYIRRG